MEENTIEIAELREYLENVQVSELDVLTKLELMGYDEDSIVGYLKQENA